MFIGSDLQCTISYKIKNDDAETQADYTKAAELEPRIVTAHINLGLIWYEQGNYAAMCREFQAACDAGACEKLESAKEDGLCKNPQP